MSGVYENEQSVVAKMRASLVEGLKGIKKADGYNCDLCDVFTEIPTLAEVRNKPAIALVRGRTVIENEDQSDQAWHKAISYTALCFLDSRNATEAREALLADLESFFGRNWMLTNLAGEECAWVVTLDGDEPFGMVMNQPQVGFAFGFTVRFAQRIDDPSVPG